MIRGGQVSDVSAEMVGNVRGKQGDQSEHLDLQPPAEMQTGSKACSIEVCQCL